MCAGLRMQNLRSLRKIRSLEGDRKSTRLNSSHDQISYAVFCLKKKKSNTDMMLAATDTCDAENNNQLRYLLVQMAGHRKVGESRHELQLDPLADPGAICTDLS